MTRQVLRLRLEKSGDARFISHLDFMRTLTHAFVRAGLPVALTQGFHPHPRFSLALALPLGASSEAEYADVELERTVDAMQAARELNRVLPPGIRVRKVQEIPVGAPPLQSQVRAARWLLDLELEQKGAGPGEAPPVDGAPAVGEGPGPGGREVGEVLTRMLAQPHLPLVREKQGRVRTLDARPLIRSARVREDGGPPVRVEAVLAAGNPSLRAGEFARLVAETGGWELRHLRVHLLEVYADRDGELVDPARLGEEAWRDYHRNRKLGFEE
ncbi:MAG: TIGR03936 family radical SAM-associated protein [Bacillota bacterium]|nr:TIGR03936 family radical SAM-associated protein [Bacillota bacterium]MDI7250068.1 TIGR03936 family radical SAM-associated protein [Bacillota bacterium]